MKASVSLQKSDECFSLNNKLQLLLAMSGQQTHYEQMHRMNPINDLMAKLIKTPQEIESFLELVELIMQVKHLKKN